MVQRSVGEAYQQASRRAAARSQPAARHKAAENSSGRNSPARLPCCAALPAAAAHLAAGVADVVQALELHKAGHDNGGEQQRACGQGGNKGGAQRSLQEPGERQAQAPADTWHALPSRSLVLSCLLSSRLCCIRLLTEVHVGVAVQVHAASLEPLGHVSAALVQQLRQSGGQEAAAAVGAGSADSSPGLTPQANTIQPTAGCPPRPRLPLLHAPRSAGCPPRRSWPGGRGRSRRARSRTAARGRSPGPGGRSRGLHNGCNGSW